MKQSDLFAKRTRLLNLDSIRTLKKCWGGSVNSLDEFVKKLCYFGGNLSSGAGDVGHVYLDIEDFFLEATLNMGKDPRITQCFLTWLIKYGIILSPSKIRGLLQQGRNVDSTVLGAFVEILEANNRQKKHWKIIHQFVHKVKTHLLFPQLLYSIHVRKSDIEQWEQEYLRQIFGRFMKSTLIFVQFMKLPKEPIILGQVFI
jgi:hypothetical protein